MMKSKALQSLNKEPVRANTLSWVNILNFGFFIIFVAILFTSFAYAETPAKEKQLKKNQQVVRYDVYAGGIHALRANLDLNLSEKNRYDVSLRAKTHGLLGKLAPWEGTFATKGWAGQENKPELHQSIGTWRGEAETKKYRYNKDGSFAGYSVENTDNDGAIRKTDKKLVEGTSDILTATLNTMELIASGKGCEGESDIFDGKRRFTMIFKQEKEVVLEASRWNAYSGPAIECTVEVKPGAGRWHSKPRGWLSIQEQGREQGKIPRVWFANIAKGHPAVPVKVRVNTDYGTLFMHMTHYQTQEQKLVLKD